MPAAHVYAIHTSTLCLNAPGITGRRRRKNRLSGHHLLHPQNAIRQPSASCEWTNPVHNAFSGDRSQILEADISAERMRVEPPVSRPGRGGNIGSRPDSHPEERLSSVSGPPPRRPEVAPAVAPVCQEPRLAHPLYVAPTIAMARLCRGFTLFCPVV